VVSPNFSLAVNYDEPDKTTLTGESNRESREWFMGSKMSIVAYSSLSRGFFSGKVTSDHPELASTVFSDWTLKEYAFPDNFERLRRAEQLAAEKGVKPVQIAFAWVLAHPLNVFPITSPSSIEHLRETIDAMDITLSPRETAWLNLDEKP
jgi:aryl-alcohol dehydrogenase-like predicted oxidoreductase